MDSVTYIGAYVVRIGLRADNPAFPVFLVFRSERLIGKQFSFPSESDCRWLEINAGKYAEASPFALASCELGKRKASATSGRSRNRRKILETA